MFFSQALLWRKGPVANIWTAAYCFKKLKREQIAQTDIASSVDQIISDIEISYRILAYLLLGIVRIFSKKVEFLEEDCNKTLTTLMESLQAIYWTNPKKSKHVRKQPVNVPETSNGGTQTGTGLIEALQAHSDRYVISVPARFELDLFDLEIVDDPDAPDTHQQSARQDKTLDDRDLFLHETFQKKSGYRIFSSTRFTPIQDVIPVEMITDLDLDITDLYDSTSSRRERNDLNPDANACDANACDTNACDADVYNTNACDANACDLSAEQHLESVQHMRTEEPDGEAEAVEPSVACHESPLKDKSMPSEEKVDATILENLETVGPLNVTDLPTIDPGSPKLMVQTPAKRDTVRSSRKRNIAWCYDQSIILSNEVMRKALNDPSDLVQERRKVPRTCLGTWRENLFNSVDQLLTEPLIPCNFSKICARASSYITPRPNNRNMKLETPVNDLRESCNDVSNVGASKHEQIRTHHIESEVHESKIVEKSVDISDKGAPLFEKIRRRLFEPETPENGPHQRSTDLSDRRCEDPSGLESLLQGSTPNKLTETTYYTLSSLDSELGSHDGDGGVDENQEGSSWSARTRYVACRLHKKVSDLKKRNQKSCLSLKQMLQGKKRKTCARFFYETLMLKGLGVIDVKQDSPYGDIKITTTPWLDEEFREN